MNDKGLVHQQNLMQDIFGVSASKPNWLSSKATYTGMAKCHPVKNGDLQVCSVLEDMKTVGAEVSGTFADSLPMIAVKKHGAGRAVFINAYLSNYKVYLPDPLPGPYHDPMSGRESMAREYRGIMRQAIGKLDALRAVKIKTAYYPEENAPYYRIGKFKGVDGAVYYPLVQESFRTSYYVPNESHMRKGQGLDCTLKLDTTGHIYDVREKRYLGFGNEVRANIYPCEAKMYAVLPYRLQSVQLALPKMVKRGKELSMAVSVAINTKAKARTNVHFQVFGPDNSEVKCYAQNLLVDGAKGKATTRFALNDKAGVWRVQATDTVSGLSTYAFMDVR